MNKQVKIKFSYVSGGNSATDIANQEFTPENAIKQLSNDEKHRTYCT